MPDVKRRKKLHKIIVGALRETIRAHGPINKILIGSAAKRIAGLIEGSERTEKKSDTNRSIDKN